MIVGMGAITTGPNPSIVPEGAYYDPASGLYIDLSTSQAYDPSSNQNIGPVGIFQSVSSVNSLQDWFAKNETLVLIGLGVFAVFLILGRK